MDSKLIIILFLAIISTSIVYSVNMDIGLILHSENNIEIKDLRFTHDNSDSLDDIGEFCISEYDPSNKTLYNGCFDYEYDTIFNLEQLAENKSYGRKYNRRFNIIIPFKESAKKIVIFQKGRTIEEYSLNSYQKSNIIEEIKPYKAYSVKETEKESEAKKDYRIFIYSLVTIFILLSIRFIKKII